MASKPRTSSTSTTLPVPSDWPPKRRGPTAPTTSRPGGRPASSIWPRTMRRVSGRSVPIEFHPPRPGDVRQSVAAGAARGSRLGLPRARWTLRRDSASSGSRRPPLGRGRARVGTDRGAPLDSRRSYPYSFLNRRKWLSGRASPCQGEGHGFESRLPLHVPRARASMQFSLFCCPQQQYTTRRPCPHTTLPAATTGMTHDLC